LDGFQFFPRRKLKTPIFDIAGIPFANKKMQIKKTAIIDVQAEKRNIKRMNCSFFLSIGKSFSENDYFPSYSLRHSGTFPSLLNPTGIKVISHIL